MRKVKRVERVEERRGEVLLLGVIQCLRSPASTKEEEEDEPDTPQHHTTLIEV